ncbi:MAG: cytochrome ubiquinol oxidase subunit I, partial [Natronospirillum sp.]
FRDGVVFVTSWREAIFNPSFPYRFTHMVMASFLTGGFVVAGVSAWYLLRRREVEANKKALSMCLWLLLFFAPAQAWVGDLHGLNTLEHQPIKVAAMEGNWETSTGVPLLLFAIPDRATQSNHFEIGIPNLASFILTHDWQGEVPGLDTVSVEDQPPVGVVFWSFRLMVGIGLLMITFAVAGFLLRLRGQFAENKLFLRGLTYMSITPFIAVVAGWFVTEVGRYPWLVYGQITLSQGLTPSLTGGMALFTLIGYFLMYAMIFFAGVYYIMRLFQVGMEPNKPEDHESEPHHAKRPWSGSDVTLRTGER